MLAIFALHTLDDPDARVRGAALSALSRIGTPRAHAAALRACQDEDPAACATALCALRALGSSADRDEIWKGALAAPPPVQRVALGTLRLLGCERLAADLETSLGLVQDESSLDYLRYSHEYLCAERRFAAAELALVSRERAHAACAGRRLIILGESTHEQPGNHAAFGSLLRSLRGTPHVKLFFELPAQEGQEPVVAVARELGFETALAESRRDQGSFAARDSAAAASVLDWLGAGPDHVAVDYYGATHVLGRGHLGELLLHQVSGAVVVLASISAYVGMPPSRPTCGPSPA